MALVYLSVSSNFNRQHNIKAALSILNGLFSGFEVSSVYRNQPLKGSGEDYFNLVLKFVVQIERLTLIARLKEIEDSLGRVRGEAVSVVNIDIDLLCYESESEKFDCNEICQRSYLLKPLSDVAGERIDQDSGLNYRQLWVEFDKSAHPLQKIELAL